MAGMVPDVEAAIEQGARIDELDSRGNDPLIYAAMHGHPEVVECLLKHGANPNSHNPTNGFTPLLSVYANRTLSQETRYRILSVLLESGANPNQVNDGGFTALHDAAVRGLAKEVNMLLARGAQVNMVAGNGETPILKASTYGHTEIVRILLAAGASMEVADVCGHTPISVARAGGHVETLSVLENCPVRGLKCSGCDTTITSAMIAVADPESFVGYECPRCYADISRQVKAIYERSSDSEKADMMRRRAQYLDSIENDLKKDFGDLVDSRNSATMGKLRTKGDATLRTLGVSTLIAVVLFAMGFVFPADSTVRNGLWGLVFVGYLLMGGSCLESLLSGNESFGTGTTTYYCPRCNRTLSIYELPAGSGEAFQCPGCGVTIVT